MYNLEDEVTSFVSQKNADGTIVLQYIVRSQAKHPGRRVKNEDNSFTLQSDAREFGENEFHFVSNRIWTIYPDGSIELNSSVTGSDAAVALARVGYLMQLPKSLDQYTYYGRGPWNNYNDRRTGAFIQQYKSTVAEQFVHFPKPQDMANREEVRWATLTNAAGNGVMFVSTGALSTTALPWNDVELTEAAHPYQLPASSGTWLHLDAKVNGLGGNSCGQGGPLEHDLVKSGENTVGFIMRPVKAGDNYEQLANVAASGVIPVVLKRDMRGTVTMSCAKDGAAIYYKIGKNGKKTLYTAPVDMSKGGTITVWEKATPKLAATYSYEAVTSIPVTVAFCSSLEPGSGAEKMLDGDPSTMWHTMYSVTVANYPHWIDFDANEEVTIKGFKYMPRQDGGNNGNVKGYKIQISADGKNWSEPIVEGEFPYSADKQTVLFKAPVKARFVRFTATSSQNGQDFASGAEFELIKE